MTLQCPRCGARYRIDPARTAKAVVRVRCPGCAEVFQVTLRPEAPSSPPPASSRKVLVVDDAKFFRELIADILKPLSLPLLLAADGREALEVIRREHPALVILDLNLPGISGHDLIRAVRADASLRDVRLLAMSGVFRGEAEAAAVEAAGADGFIGKSFKPEQLQARVARLLEGQK